MREFKSDFLMPAISGLSEAHQRRVALALDCAIAFGALEHAQGNESLQDVKAIEKAYEDKCRRLQVLSGS